MLALRNSTQWSIIIPAIPNLETLAIAPYFALGSATDFADMQVKASIQSSIFVTAAH